MATNTPSPATDADAAVLFYAVPEVARRLGVGQTTMWGLIRDKRIPVVHIGRRTLVPRDALMEFVGTLASAQG